MTERPTYPGQQPSLGVQVVEIQLLALDLKTCTRCLGTLGNIEKAVDSLKDVLASTGTEVRFTKIVVATEDHARRLRFLSSPTIRVNERDIVFETLESACDSCSDLCGCAEGTNCRVWQYRGQEYTEAPVGLIVEAVLREIAGTPPRVEPSSFAGVTENLRQFFAGSDRRPEAGGTCCSPKAKKVCCEPDQKDTCCGTTVPKACGCL
jgi:hypothetical protein